MSKFDELKEKAAAKINEVKADHESGDAKVDDRVDQVQHEAQAGVEKLGTKLD